MRFFGFVLFCFFWLSLAATGAQAAWEPPQTFDEGFGVQIKPELADDEQLEHIRQIGFGYVRFSLGWQGIERKKGHYDWSDVDPLVARVRAHHLKMVIPLLGGHGGYDGFVPAPQDNVDGVNQRPRAPSSPETMQAYARFVVQAVLRYGTQDIVWELWNEPDLARFWPPHPDEKAFPVLADLTCRMVRQVRPQAVLVGPALGRVPDVADGVTPAFFSAFLASPAAQCLDAISVHPYRHGGEIPEAVFADYATLFGLMGKHKNYKPLMNTEWGYDTSHVSLEEQARYAARMRFLDMMWGVPLTIWYEWQDSGGDAENPEAHFGFKTLAGGPKKAIQVLENIFTATKGARYKQQVHTQDPRDMLLLFEKESGQTLLIGWSLREKGPDVSFLWQGKIKKTKTLTQTPAILGCLPVLTEIKILNH